MALASKHFVLRFTPSKEAAKLIVSLSKKNFKKAVTRNAIRRRVKAIIAKEIKASPSGVYLLIGKVHAEDLRGEALKAELGTLFNFDFKRKI